MHQTFQVESLTTVYPKKYAHGFCFAVLCCGYTLTDFPISIRLTSLALWQSNDCPSASKATLRNMDKYFMWVHYERLHNHNKAKHNKTVCIFLGIYCKRYHMASWYAINTDTNKWLAAYRFQAIPWTKADKLSIGPFIQYVLTFEQVYLIAFQETTFVNVICKFQASIWLAWSNLRIVELDNFLAIFLEEYLSYWSGHFHTSAD